MIGFVAPMGTVGGMLNLVVPSDPEEQVGQVVGLLGPVGEHPHWKSLARVVVGERGLLTYSGSREGEHWNLSNWFGLLNDRAGWYPEDEQGQLIRSLYVAHELAHLLAPTPHAVDRRGFAKAFDLSERLASYETEFRIYDDLPELESRVPFSPLLATWLRGRGVDLSDVAGLMSWRDAVVAEPELLAKELPSEAARLGSYGDNEGWARGYWDRLNRIGWWGEALACRSAVFTPANYREGVVRIAEMQVDRIRWERMVVDNVRRAYMLCGLSDPGAMSLDEAREAAAGLDGEALAVELTPSR